MWICNSFWLSRDFVGPPHDQGVVRLYGQESFRISYNPTKFRGNKHSGSGDILALACHVISQDHAIRGSFDFIGSSP